MGISYEIISFSSKSNLPLREWGRRSAAFVPFLPTLRCARGFSHLGAPCPQSTHPSGVWCKETDRFTGSRAGVGSALSIRAVRPTAGSRISSCCSGRREAPRDLWPLSPVEGLRQGVRNGSQERAFWSERGKRAAKREGIHIYLYNRFKIKRFLLSVLKRSVTQRCGATRAERGTMGINTVPIAEATLIRCLDPARSNA